MHLPSPLIILLYIFQSTIAHYYYTYNTGVRVAFKEHCYSDSRSGHSVAA
jgi:hypothetical protein